MNVIFNDHEEFINEMRLEKDHVVDEIVRVTKVYRPTQLPGVRLVLVSATAEVRGKIIKLETLIGDLMISRGPVASHDQITINRSAKMMKAIEDGVRKLGLEPRAGFLEETTNAQH